MKNEFSTFLMFGGRAEEAMNFYVSLFDDGKVTLVDKYGPDEAGAEGSILRASFELNGQRFMCIDSPVKQDFGFNPAISIYVDCHSVLEVERLYYELMEEGKVMIPMGEYPFSKRFVWVSDRFGVSWQLSCAHTI